MSSLTKKIRQMTRNAASNMQAKKVVQRDLPPTVILRKSSDKRSIDLRLTVYYRLTDQEVSKIVSVMTDSVLFDKEIEKVIERKKRRDENPTESYVVELGNNYGTSEFVPVPVKNFPDIEFDRNKKLIACNTGKIRIAQEPSVTNSAEEFAFRIKKGNDSYPIAGRNTEVVNSGIVTLREPNIPTDISQSIYRESMSDDAPIAGDLHVEIARNSVNGFFTVDNRFLKQDSFGFYMKTKQSGEQKSVQVRDLSVVPGATKDNNLTMYRFSVDTSGSSVSFSIRYDRFSRTNEAKEIIREMEKHTIDIGSSILSYVNSPTLLKDLDSTYKKTRRFIENKKEEVNLYEEIVGTKEDKIRALEDIKTYFIAASESIKDANFMNIGVDGNLIDNMPNHVYKEIELGSVTAPDNSVDRDNVFKKEHSLEEFQAVIRAFFTNRKNDTLKPHYTRVPIESTDIDPTHVLEELGQVHVLLNREKEYRGSAYLLVGYAKSRKGDTLLKKPIWKPALDDDFASGTYLAKAVVIDSDGNRHEEYLTVRKE